MFLVKRKRNKMFRINNIQFHNFRNILDSKVNLSDSNFKTDLGGHMIGVYGANGSSKSSIGYALAMFSKLSCGMSYAFFHDFDNDFGIYDETMVLEYDFDYSFGEKFKGIVHKFEFKKYLSADSKEEKVYISEETLKLKTASGRPIVYSVPRDYNYLNCLIKEEEVSRIADLFSSDNSLIYALNSSAIKEQQSFFLNRFGMLNVMASQSANGIKQTEQFSYITRFLSNVIANAAFIMPDLYGTSITNNLFAIISGNTNNTEYLIKEPNGFFKCDGKKLEKIEAVVATSNRFIKNIVPGFEVIVDKKELDKDEKGITNYQIRLLSKKDKGNFSFENESEGIKRLFLISSCIAKVMNVPDFILFIDEFDEGIFEVLFGDIIRSIKSQCMGQFIFTSHNLRPLEVMEYPHFIFSTTNPKNRFVTLKGIKPKNNLRDVYIRKIMYGDENNLSNFVDESDILGGLIDA